MVNTLDMQDLRQLNLFQRITRIQTRFCFPYNNMIVFCVPKDLVNRAVGKNGENVKKISQVLKKRIKIIPKPNGIEGIEKFIRNIVSPVEFKEVEVKDNEIILNAGSQSKAALIGRNKRRLLEMQNIVKNFFGKEFKIV
jgi:NusA-like KH domain protein